MLARNGFGEMPEYNSELEGGFTQVCCPGKSVACNFNLTIDFELRILFAKENGARGKEGRRDRAGLSRQRQVSSCACHVLASRRMELSRGDGNLSDA